MSKACYVLFECYSEGILLFRSYAKIDEDPVPKPLSDPHLQCCQNTAIENGRRLSYEYLSGLITKAAAVAELQKRNSVEDEREQLAWLACSGTRLSAKPHHALS